MKRGDEINWKICLQKFVLIGLILSIIFVTSSVARPLEDAESKPIESKTDEKIIPDTKLDEKVEIGEK